MYICVVCVCVCVCVFVWVGCVFRTKSHCSEAQLPTTF